MYDQMFIYFDFFRLVMVGKWRQTLDEAALISALFMDVSKKMSVKWLKTWL